MICQPQPPLKIKEKKWTISLFFEPQQLMRLNDKPGPKKEKWEDADQSSEVYATEQ